ncbi:hypothetical protein PpBr36_03935 [Pyricularia pennisetigena]|uniref:hypothetical protein n=1 Tax=Pyricularia pennisetigena TaxID=1578925 RepID=UPI001150D3D4|nr:hypothetical protein PpBr36_03935 [Pyricularia pennisetigena]TLS30659.1 hypothetical protein PpBr36_03935 [Pyricularia pennisetigena]
MADAITAAASSPTGLSSPASEKTQQPSTAEQQVDLTDDSPPENNKFAFTPAQLHKLSLARSLEVLDAFGGLHGLAAGLRTDLQAGLSIDEDQLEGTVPFEEAVRAGREKRPPAIKPLETGADQQKHGAFKLDLADLGAAGAHQQRGFVDRRRVFGENKLPKRKQRSFLELAWIAFNDKLIFLLTASATISLALGIYEAVEAEEGEPRIQWLDSVTVMVAIAVIVFGSATNDWNKNRKFAKLNERKEQRDVKVIRSGKTMNISIYDLLVGDIMHIETGDVVAVDGVLVNGSGIQVDESSLSGESELVHKTAIGPTDGAGKQPEKEKAKAEKQTTHRVTASDPFILSGTTVNGGVGNYLVISVGTNSTFGRTLMNLRTEVEETPLQQKLGKLARQLITLGAIAGLVFFLIMFIRFCVGIPGSSKTSAALAMEFFKTLILAVTVVVVTVPEGLALAVTLGLAFATSRMLKDKNLVRMIRSCEVMGNATCICSDKTGTLTQNVMTVVAGNVGVTEAFGEEATAIESDNNSPEASGPDVDKKAAAAAAPPPPVTASSARQFVARLAPEVKDLIRAGIVHNTTAFESDDGFVGMSTETALLKFAREHLAMGPLNEERTNADIVDMFPFDASNKWMAVMVKLPGDGGGGGYRLLVKGAAEVVLDRCTRVLSSDPRAEAEEEERDAGGLAAAAATDEFSSEMHTKLRQVVQSYAVKMLRPVAMAYRDFQDPVEVFEDVKDPTSIDFKAKFERLTFLSLFAIKDPLRPEVNDAVRKCQEAGVFVRMVTGDNFLTAKAIATECGIYTAGGIAMDGPTFRKLSEAQLDLVIPRLQVLARSSPEDKLLLVSHLKGMMETVAVTGDGTNDALALKAADVGFAMGIQGTEVAKEAASIILLDDNFTSIVKALSWGRTVNDAVRKFLQFQFTINITAGTLTVVSELSGDNIFKVVQLLWMNLIMDIFASLGLATDYPSPDFLKRKPQPRKTSLVSLTMWKMIVGQALYQLIVIFTLHYGKDALWNPQTETERDQLQTLVFNIYVWMQFFNQHNCRRVDNKLNIWYQGVLRNPWFIGVQCLTFAGQMVIIWKGGQAFQTTPLNGPQWGWSMLFGILTIPLGVLIRLTPDRYAGNVFHFFGQGLRFLWRGVLVFVPSRWSKRKRNHLERRRSRRSANEDGDDQTSDGAMNNWVLQAGDVLRRPINYDWATMGRPHEAALASRIQTMPAAQREALARAAQAHAAALSGANRAEHEVDLPAMIDAARNGSASSAMEIHPDTRPDDPILPEGTIDVQRWKKVPPSQDPEVIKYLESQQHQKDE